MPIDAERGGLYAVWGLAVLGMAVANIPGFALVWPAADLPVVHGPFDSGASQFAWWLTQTFFTWKFNLLFLVAFGGWLGWMVLPGATPGDAPGRHLGWLAGIGVLHGYLVWYGDILVVTAIAALIASATAALPARTRFTLALVLTGFTLLMIIAGAAILALLPASIDLANAFGFPPARLEAIETSWQGGFLARLPGNLALVLQFELIQLVFLLGGVTGVLLIGMAAVETGFLSARWPSRIYVAGCATALGVGLPLCGWSGLNGLGTAFDPNAVWASVATQAVGSVLVAFGYASGLMLMIREDVAGRVIRLLAEAGTLWLSLYLGQSAVFALVFFGLPGLAQFGRIDQMGQLLIALGLVALALTAVIAWSGRFRFGPAEWVWYSLARWRRQPLRQASGSASG